MDIPIYYDPMIAKLITHGATREEAINRMVRAIDEYQINGVQTTLSFCRFVMQHDAFRSGKFDTHFVKQHFRPEYLLQPTHEGAQVAAMMAALLHQRSGKAPVAAGVVAGPAASAWKRNRTQSR
jgi:propionyl-CoA carboxylase alpha chain